MRDALTITCQCGRQDAWLGPIEAVRYVMTERDSERWLHAFYKTGGVYAQVCRRLSLDEM